MEQRINGGPPDPRHPTPKLLLTAVLAAGCLLAVALFLIVLMGD